jgi:hypothetical protein
MPRHETREIATCLRNGSLWVGRFVVEHDDLDFGDDRRDARQGLARYVRARPARSADWIQARLRPEHRAAEDKHAALREMRAALERLKWAA